MVRGVVFGVAVGMLPAVGFAAGGAASGPAATAAAVAPDWSASILTPPAPATPQIHTPARFGVRPQAPFLFTIAATGDRPMTFAAEHLPAGLTLSVKTGQITGKLSGPGTTEVTLRATNAQGTAEKKLAIVSGERSR